jgi:hypothetical protein
MNKYPNLLGTPCESPHGYKIKELRELAGKLKIDSKKSFELMCADIRSYYNDNTITTQDELNRHLKRVSEHKKNSSDYICGISNDNMKNCRRGVDENTEYCQYNKTTNSCGKNPEYSNYQTIYEKIRHKELTVQPKVAVAVQPKVAVAVQPKVAVAVQPKVAVAVQPKVAVAVQPKLKELDIDLDILFNSNSNTFLKSVEYFRNLKYYTNVIEPIGANSVNGFIRKLTYNKNGTEYPIVLKSSADIGSDNLIYEFLVGQCINIFAQYYPCFSKTYFAGFYNDERIYNAFKKLVVTSKMPAGVSLSDYLTIPHQNDLEQLIKEGCLKSKFACIFTQYIPIRKSFYKYIQKYSKSTPKHIEVFQPKFVDKLYTLIIGLHMTYQLLSSLANFFTHYDLHFENIVLVKLPKKTYITINYHNSSKEIISYKTKYIPIIIDYGHSFVNCQKMNTSVNNSHKIMKTVCNYDVDNPDKTQRMCLSDCGNFTGFRYTKSYDEKTDTFKTRGSHYINPTSRNITHDLRLLDIIAKWVDFSHLKGNSFIEKSVKDFFKKMSKFDDAFGAPENKNSDQNKIYNVHTASELLNSVVANSQFNTNNNRLFDDKSLYGILDIWTDLSRPFQFIKSV